MNASTGALTIKKTGTATIKATAAANDEYVEKTAKYTIKIVNGTPEYQAPSRKDSLVYNGSEQELINPGAASNGTIYYKLEKVGTNTSKTSNTTNPHVPEFITMSNKSADDPIEG
ncbi:MAG: hypothetical protein K6F93_07345 [Lachnospiraceae bacterium]|nr:hypothetical protein [Lachnospiraceae bacterium]